MLHSSREPMSFEPASIEETFFYTTGGSPGQPGKRGKITNEISWIFISTRGYTRLPPGSVEYVLQKYAPFGLRHWARSGIVFDYVR
jgi:hypothetical protein